jgi:hypothetical protein
MNTPQSLLDHRSEPDVRAVIEDMDLDQGRRPMRIGLALWIIHTDAVAATDAATADAATADDTTDTDADAAADDGDVADSDTDAAAATADVAADDDTTDTDAVAVADDDTRSSLLTKLILEEPDMRNGLKIIQVPGRYGYSVTRIGWMRRVSGDEFELVNARTITRTGEPRTLASLAHDGPKRDHGLSDMDEGVEEVHRLVIRRSRPASEAAWIKHCPKPGNWVDE